MTSSEADRFMEQHPEIAVKVLPVRIDGAVQCRGWMAFDYPDDKSLRQMVGATREDALARYEILYHPKQPVYCKECGRFFVEGGQE